MHKADGLHQYLHGEEGGNVAVETWVNLHEIEPDDPVPGAHGL